MKSHLVIALLLMSACSDDASSIVTPILIVDHDVSEADRAAHDDALAQLVTHIATLTGHTPEVVSGDVLAEARRARAGLVIELASTSDFDDDGFRLTTEEAGAWRDGLDGSPGATVVHLAATTRLGRQYAIYEFCRRLGARFFHPEAAWLPSVADAQLRTRARTPTALGAGPDFRPDFRHRSWTFHGAHPLEHLESFSDARHPIDEAEHVNRWIVQNRGDIARGAGRGVAPADERQRRADELEALADRLGLRRGAGITLHNQQQGSTPDIDPSSPVSVADQIDSFVKAIAERGADPYTFGIHFGPTELTTTPDRETVDWINLAGAAARKWLPGVPVEINDHITGHQPTEHFDDLGCPSGTNDRGVSDYYDLAFHTDADLGVKVHTVMFYPLEGPAPVYGQVSFAHKLCLMRKAADVGRPVVWFPEGAYWLSFDNAVPVYLPLYIGARQRDIQLVTPLLASRGGSVADHRMFDSGHEWGYWQQDYAVGLWGWDVELTLAQVLGEMGDPLCDGASWPPDCAARTSFVEVLTEVIAEQQSSFLTKPDYRGRPGGLYWYFAGEDPADELGAVSGLEFRPVRLAFRDVAGLSERDAEALAGDLDELARMDTAYAAWADRLSGVRADVPEAGRPWLDEVVDGLTINALRARHTRALYRVAVALAASPDLGSEDTDVVGLRAEAAAALAEASAVITRREASYRYPLAQEIGRGDNGTTYPFRVHTKTHELAYWQNRQAQIDDLVEGRDAVPTTLVATPVIADPGTRVSLTWPPLDGLAGQLAMGDGASVAVGTASHDYPAGEGIWTIVGELDTDGAPLSVRGSIVRASVRGATGSGDFTLVEPDSELAQTVLGAIVPPLRLALADGVLALVAEPGGRDSAPFTSVTTAAVTVADGESGVVFASEVFAFALPIPDPSTGRIAASVAVTDAALEGPANLRGEAFLTGELAVADLVAALVALAGFDADGATETLAGVLGFDAADPPSTVPFRAALTLGPDGL